jgi:hypothetical protein
MHLFDTICCICIPLHKTFLMMALKQPKHVGGSSQMKKIFITDGAVCWIKHYIFSLLNRIRITKKCMSYCIMINKRRCCIYSVISIKWRVHLAIKRTQCILDYFCITSASPQTIYIPNIPHEKKCNRTPSPKGRL